MPKKKFSFKGKGPTLLRKEGHRRRLKEIKQEKGGKGEVQTSKSESAIIGLTRG